jgi:protein-tyrosine phosphatase
MFRYILGLSVLLLLGGCEQDIALDQRIIPSKVDPSLRENNRKLIFDGVYNFRELGGIRSAGGRAVRWGKIYRSSNLSSLSETDQMFLEALEIRRIVDFRLDAELVSDGRDTFMSDANISVVHMPVGDEAELEYIRANMQAGKFHESDARELLETQNRMFVKDFTPIYRDWMHSLLEEENYPMVFHCSTGKDRAGLAAALVLLTLGVPMDRVMEDYLDTNRFTSDWVYKELATMNVVGMVGKIDLDAVKVLYGVEREFLEAAFKAMRDQYGSIDAYIESGLEMSFDDRERLKSILLE